MRCSHPRTRNIHGDEIWHAMSLFGTIRRQRCLDCGKALNLPPNPKETP